LLVVPKQLKREHTMRSGLSVISMAAIPLLVVAIQTTMRSSTARAQASAKVTLTTDPSPAQKGKNTVRVKLTDAEDKPVSGAEVTVTFFMAAMPSMNMPEMKTVIKGEGKGAGMYEGEGELGSGGMWQVTVTAKQKGKTIVAKKLTVKATGGM
jgi:Cu(I)/Ag(I) efflux system membrane fusion protein